MKSWNIVLNKIMEIKHKYLAKEDIRDADIEFNNDVEKWIYALNDEYYTEMIKPLQLNQFGDLLLVKYANYSKLGISVVSDDFWNSHDGFYKECRSVVLNLAKEELVLTPFKKFRNLDESEEMSLDNIRKRISQAKCVEFSNKLDGSMQSARWYDGKLVMSGSQSLDKEQSWRLEDGYNNIISQDNYMNMIKSMPNVTFIFEYISLKDAHIVRYTKEQEGMYLIGIRNVDDGIEWNYKDILSLANLWNVKTTEVYNKQLDEVVSELGNKQSNEAEGFVLNIDGYKVKIKYDDYLKMHKAISSLISPHAVVKSIADDNFDDFYSKIPDAYKSKVKDIADKVIEYVNNIDKQVKEYMKDSPKERKEFMIWCDDVVPKEMRGYCKAMYLGKKVNYLCGNGQKLLMLIGEERREKRLLKNYKFLNNLINFCI